MLNNKLHRQQRRAWQDERSVAGSAGGGGGGSGGALPCSCCAYCDSMPWLRPLTAGGMPERQSELPLQLPHAALRCGGPPLSPASPGGSAIHAVSVAKRADALPAGKPKFLFAVGV